MSLTKRLFGRVSNLGGDGCWLWEGSVRFGGYGQIRTGKGRATSAHRASYELLVGPVPEGLVLDHLCRVPACVRPSHLEPVTNRVNLVRGIGFTAINHAKTHCVRGHEFTPENTLRRKDRLSRGCRECHRIRERAYYRLENGPIYEGPSFYCGNGHPRIPENVRMFGNRPDCKVCNREAQARMRIRRQEGR